MWKKVERDTVLNVDLDVTPLQIKTNSTLGSGEEVVVYLYDEQGTQSGGFLIRFLSQPKYAVVRCHKTYASFPNALPVDDNKVWTIEKTTYGLTFTCNGELVVNIVLSDDVCDYDEWRSFWINKNRKLMKFDSKLDTASEYWKTYTGTKAEALMLDINFRKRNTRDTYFYRLFVHILLSQ